MNHHWICDSSEMKKKKKDWLHPLFLTINKAGLMAWNWSTWRQEEADNKSRDLLQSPRGAMVMKGSEAIISSAQGFSVWSMDQYGLTCAVTLSRQSPPRCAWTCQTAIINAEELVWLQARIQMSQLKAHQHNSVHPKGQALCNTGHSFLQLTHTHTHTRDHKQVLVWGVSVCARHRGRRGFDSVASASMCSQDSSEASSEAY